MYLFFSIWWVWTVFYRVVIAERERAEITIHNPKGEKEQPKRFTFDSAYGVDATQREIYDRTASPIVGKFYCSNRFIFLVEIHWFIITIIIHIFTIFGLSVY